MKQVIQFIALIAIVFAGLMTTGCNDNSGKKTVVTTVPVTVSVTTDTTIYVTEKTVKTADRYDCNGNKLKNPKLLSVDTTMVPLHITQTGTKTVDVNCNQTVDPAKTGVSDDSNSSSNNSGSGSGSSSNAGGNWDWLGKILPILALIALLALLAWLLWWLFNQIPKRNNSSTQKTNFMQNSAANPTRIAELTALNACMRGPNGDGKGKIIDRTLGGFEMTAGEDNPGVHIVIKGNSGNVYIGNLVKGDANASSIPVEPKKDEPAAVAPATPAP